MEQDEDAFLYGDEPSAKAGIAYSTNSQQAPLSPAAQPSDKLPGPPGKGKSAVPGGGKGEEKRDLEEGEEEEVEVEVDDSEDEIEFVIERKDGSRPEPPPQPSRYNQVRMAPSRPASDSPAKTQTTSQLPASTTPQAPPTGPSSTVQQPPTAASKLDLDANPSYSGAPIRSISLESEALLPADKPWRKPGADVTDYFNYGFDEFTWTAYCQRQDSLREEFDPRKMMEQMMLISGMTGGLGMPGMVDPSAVGVGGMDMNAAAMMGFNHGGTGGAPAAPVGANSGADMGMGVGVGVGVGVGGMVDPSMYGGGPMGGGYDDRGGGAAYGMGGDLRRAGIPPQGPQQGMGAYGNYDQSMMQQQQQSVRGGYGRGVRGRRGW